MRLPVEDVLLGLTSAGAAAVGRPDLGVLRVDGPADLVMMRPPPGERPSAAALVQSMGASAASEVWCSGVRRR
jgi:cytosine/adenosine deaminase-related metal-dependent hydrolase